MNSNIIKSVEKRKLLILSVANCNMRCDYCFVSNGMNLKSIESYKIKRYAKELLLEIKKPIIVKFFGGEPLLEKEYFFDLIESCSLAGKGHNFNIGTNGTLLDKEDVNFLLEKNVQLIVSSDGNTELNNKHRKFINSKEAGSVIIEKMSMIRESAEYHGKLNLIFFSAVLLHDTDMKCIFDWFYKNKIQLVFNFPYRINFSKNEIDEFIRNYDHFMNSVLLIK